jgi:hypothetical protein
MAQALAGLRWADSRDSTRREVLQAVEALLDSQGMPKKLAGFAPHRRDGLGSTMVCSVQICCFW